MAKSKEKVIYTNNIDKNYMLEKRRKIEMEKRLRSNAWILRFFFIALFLAYLWSDYSKIMTISVYGNEAISKDAIVEMSNLSNDSFFYFFAPKYVELKIKQNPLIQSVSVQRKNNNIVRVDIVEKRIVASILSEGVLKYLCNDGGIVNVGASNIDYMTQIPYVSGLDEESELIVLFAKNLEKLSKETQMLISEIVLYPMSYDKTQLKIHMIDHNKVYVPILYLESINSYQKIISALSENNVCLFFDSFSTQPYVGECLSNEEESGIIDESDIVEGG